MNEIRAYADACNIKPATVLQRAAGYGGKAWQKWEAGGQCTLGTAEIIRDHMADNPPTSATAKAVGSVGSCPLQDVGTPTPHVKGNAA